MIDVRGGVLSDPPIKIGGYKMLDVSRSYKSSIKTGQNVSKMQLLKSFSLNTIFEKHCGKCRLSFVKWYFKSKNDVSLSKNDVLLSKNDVLLSKNDVSLSLRDKSLSLRDERSEERRVGKEC